MFQSRAEYNKFGDRVADADYLRQHPDEADCRLDRIEKWLLGK